MAPEASFAALELRDRAVRFLSQRGVASLEELIEHVYGGATPPALRERLAAPLRDDPRLERRPDGSWSLRGRSDDIVAGESFTALAVAATGPSPGRASIVRVSALHVEAGEVLEHFDAIVNPGRHVPRYVSERAGLASEVLDSQPPFAEVLDDLARFLGERPVLAQDAQLTWAFIDAEARRVGRVLVTPPLFDLNELATQILDLKGKPSLSHVAAALGVGSVRLGQTDEEARVLASVGSRLLASLGSSEAGVGSKTLRRGATARALPDQPGIYVLRDRNQTPLYVGKARRLRSRIAAYVHRPLGPTRRLEGLVAAVDAVDSTQCASDLEALILEDREIRRLQPRFNTVRAQRTPRYWIRLPSPPASGPRKRQPAPPRLELSPGPGSAEGEFVGPFRNEWLAEQARTLAREVFELDTLRSGRSLTYLERLAEAWAFLRGDSSRAEVLARVGSTALLRQVVVFDVAALLLPADPRHARYAVIRPGPGGVEGFLLDRAILRGFVADDGDDAFAFARQLLAPAEPRTTGEDVDVVLRWFGAQRPPARLVLLLDEPLAAADAIEQAVLDVLAREA